MTNEELAVAIQGGQREMLPALWDNIQAYTRLQAARWLRAWQPYRAGLEFEDLYLCGWPAMVAAVETYDPSKAKFLTWFHRHLLTEFARELGIRTRRAANDPLHSLPASLDAELPGAEGMTLSDVVPDDTEPFTAAEDSIYQQQVRNVLDEALSRLPERDRDIVTSIFLKGEPRASVAQRHHCKKQTLSQYERAAFHRMKRRDGAKLAELLYGSSEAYCSGLRSWQQAGSSTPERLVLRADKFDDWGD